MTNSWCKIKTYIGFAKKSRNIIYGTDDIIKLIKKSKLIIVSNELSHSSLQKIQNVANKNERKLIILNNQLCQELFENENIKAIAITDGNLSDAIKNLLD